MSILKILKAVETPVQQLSAIQFNLQEKKM